GRWSIDFYRRQADLLSTDSGFRELGYLILAATKDEERVGRERVAMQRGAGLDVRWVDPDEAVRLDPALRASSIRGASYAATDGCIDPVRNVRAYSLAMQAAGVELREDGAWIDVPIPVGAVRHQVAVTEPHVAFQADRRAMAFDLSGGLYWRLEDGGLLFGMSNPEETPGPARSIDWEYLAAMRRRLAHFLPVTDGLELRKVWAATIDYTP